MEYPRRRPVASLGVGAGASGSPEEVGGAGGRLGQREDGGQHLQRLARMAHKAGAAEAELLASLGWVVGAQPDSSLPVRLLSRAATGGATHPQTLALARFLVMRSVRCRRSAQEHLQLARSVLGMFEQLRPQDRRPAAWLGLVYILAERYAEACRQLAAFGSQETDLAAAREALHVASLLLNSARARTGPAGGGLHGPRDPAVQALAASRQGVCVLDGMPEVEATGDADLEVRAFRATPVVIRGPRGTASLPVLEGELLVALLSLSWGSGSASSGGGPWVPRADWVAALWPLAGDPVGRLLGLFSSSIRRLRAKLQQSAGKTVIEVSHKEGYRLRADVRVRLSMDVASLAGNWLLARLPAPSRW